MFWFPNFYDSKSIIAAPIFQVPSTAFIRFSRAQRSVLLAGASLLALAIDPATACVPGPSTFCVITSNDDGTGQAGTLSAAINAANAFGGGMIEIDNNFVSQVDITGDMPLINFSGSAANGGTTQIVGNGATIDGGGQHRILFADSGAVNISDLTLQNGHAEGGDGGDAELNNGSGGGGGMGAGGALFVNEGAAVNGSNVHFADNEATGGQGGRGADGIDFASDPNAPQIPSLTTPIRDATGAATLETAGGSGGGGGLHGDGGDALGGSGGGGGFRGSGGDSQVNSTNASTFGSFSLTEEHDAGGGGGGGGGLEGDGGDARRGGGGGGSIGNGGTGGGSDSSFAFRFPSVVYSSVGNVGGGGGGGGASSNGADAPTATSSVPHGNVQAGLLGGGGGAGSDGAAPGASAGVGLCASAPLNNGNAGANATIGGGGGGSAGQALDNTSGFNIVCSPESNGAAGGDGATFGGGGGGGAAPDGVSRVSTPSGTEGSGGDGGDGGDYGGGGGGGSGGDLTHTGSSTVPDYAGDSGGDGGNGGIYAGGGGAGFSDVTAISHADGGDGGDLGGGGGTSYGEAGEGGYGGGGGGATHGVAGDGGFGGGGGGAGADDLVPEPERYPSHRQNPNLPYDANTNPSIHVLVTQGTAGASSFGGGLGGEADQNTSSGSGGGGGGLGAGGAVFVRQGGQLNLSYTDDSTYNTNDVSGGAGGLGYDANGAQSSHNGGSGLSRGHAYFLDDSRARIDIAADFTVIYDEDIDDAREIGRAGGLDKHGCGTMQYGIDPTLSNPNPPSLVMPYGDSTDVYEGEFNVRSDARLLYSTTNIAAGGPTTACGTDVSDQPLLSGAGILADTNILDGGRHNAGNNPGDIATMTVQGDYTIGDGGRLEIDAGPGGAPNSDTIVVLDRPANDALYSSHPVGVNNATVQDSQVVITSTAILEVFFQPGTYNTGDEWLIIDNEGTTDLVEDENSVAILDTDISGGFGTVIHNLGFNSVTVETNGNRGGISDGNNVVLRFQGPQCDLTFNQNSTLGGSVTLNSTGDVVQSFDNLPDELKCPTLDTMSGEAHVSAAGMLLERSMALTGSIATRVAASWMQDGPAITGVRASQWLATWKRPDEVSAAMEREEAGLEPLPRSVDMEANPEQYPEGWGAPLEEPEKTTVWGRMLGDFRFVSGDGNAADAFRYGAGMMVGADTKTSEHTRVGIAVGVGRDWINVDERRRTNITVDSISGSLYGSYTEGAWQAMLVGSVAHQMWETERRILFPDNSIDRTTRAEYDAFYWAIRGELGYMHMTDSNWLIRPSVTARWAELHTDGFQEDGAQDINLLNDGEVYRSIQTSVGLRASKEKQLDNGWMRTFQIKGEWLHQWSDKYQEATFAFEGDGTNPREPFVIRSPEESPASAILGLGLSFTNDSGLTGFVTGDAILSPTTIHPSMAAGIKIRF